MNKSKIFSIIVLVVVVLGAIWYFMFYGKKITTPPVVVEKVATVNGVDISKTFYDTELASTISSSKAQGVDVTNADELAKIKTQVLDALINNELISQGIASAGIKTTDAEVETRVQDIIKQVGGTTQFQTELTNANLTEAQLRDSISKQLAIQKYLAANIDVTGITASDAEISLFYTEYSKAQTTASSTIKVPALKDLKTQIEQQIITNKQQVLVNNFITSLRDKAKIEKFI
ncbi:MAG: SurA N-terminal domain-containing protein [Candidatus Zambryskibacteria bacterium]|nr:SurA N-terminal domain-containing protein [Candidatus Zambryskibacteria bacterium]